MRRFNEKYFWFCLYAMVEITKEAWERTGVNVIVNIVTMKQKYKKQWKNNLVGNLLELIQAKRASMKILNLTEYRITLLNRLKRQLKNL